MSDQDKHEQQGVQQEQADLEVSEEDADEVEGGVTKIRFGADRDPQGLRVKI